MIHDWQTSSPDLCSANMRPSACHQSKWNCGCPPELPAWKRQSPAFRQRKNLMLRNQRGLSRCPYFKKKFSFTVSVFRVQPFAGVSPNTLSIFRMVASAH